MKLMYAKSGGDLLIGEVNEVIVEKSNWLLNPMAVGYSTVTIPPKINGSPPQQVRQYQILPLPCKEIYLTDIAYWGYVKPTDPLAELYAQTLRAVETRESRPLLKPQ